MINLNLMEILSIEEVDGKLLLIEFLFFLFSVLEGENIEFQATCGQLNAVLSHLNLI